MPASTRCKDGSLASWQVADHQVVLPGTGDGGQLLRAGHADLATADLPAGDIPQVGDPVGRFLGVKVQEQSPLSAAVSAFRHGVSQGRFTGAALEGCEPNGVRHMPTPSSRYPVAGTLLPLPR